MIFVCKMQFVMVSCPMFCPNKGGHHCETHYVEICMRNLCNKLGDSVVNLLVSSECLGFLRKVEWLYAALTSHHITGRDAP